MKLILILFILNEVSENLVDSNRVNYTLIFEIENLLNCYFA